MIMIKVKLMSLAKKKKKKKRKKERKKKKKRNVEIHSSRRSLVSIVTQSSVSATRATRDLSFPPSSLADRTYVHLISPEDRKCILLPTTLWYRVDSRSSILFSNVDSCSRDRRRGVVVVVVEENKYKRSCCS